jgi:NADPH-dependent 2,4-dienoyl-CoA reductase/sulfur reductase-like enzyme/rhodanese-related sulfurtransferase
LLEKGQDMPKRIVIVGGVAAGASAAAKARRTDEQAEIVVIEKGPYVSFANCGLPYYLGGEIASRQALFVSSPERFADFFRIETRLNTTVTAISAAAKTVSFLGPDGTAGTLAYDRLILADGTVPILPPIPGLDAPNLFHCRTVPDVDGIMARIDGASPATATGDKQALIIGGGYIGLECAEQLARRGFATTLIEAQEQILGPLDREMAHLVQVALEAQGTTVVLEDAVAAIQPAGPRAKALLKSGGEVLFDIGIIGAGVRPNVALARSAGLSLGQTGAIAVDAHQRTSDPAIFAAGDNSESVFLPTGTKAHIPLAGPANKQGRVAGHNAALDLAGTDSADPGRLTMKGVLATAIVRVGETVAGGTGLTEKLAKRLGITVASAYVFGNNHAGYYPGASQILLKLIYDPASGRILGAQAVGQDGVDKRLDVMATAIRGRMTVEDLEDLDLSYAPPFGSVRDVVMMAGFVASNARRGDSPGASPVDLSREMTQPDAAILIDVRTAREFAQGHVEPSVNIPLNALRGRLSEIPQGRPVRVICGTGYRSYLAQRILLNSGWTDVRNVYGGNMLQQRLGRVVS